MPAQRVRLRRAARKKIDDLHSRGMARRGGRVHEVRKVSGCARLIMVGGGAIAARDGGRGLGGRTRMRG